MAKNGKSGGMFLTLFSLPFAGVGVGMVFLVAWTIIIYIQQKSWVQVPAKITHTELVAHRSSKSTTYKVEASYDYEYKGKWYRGASKVSQFSGSDNISRFHQDLHAELKKCFETGKNYRCFVNPDNHDEAVLYRGLRPVQLGFLTLFAVVFGGAGFSLFTVGLKGVCNDRRIHKLRAVFSDQPWLQRPEWHSGVINSSSKLKMLISIVLAFFWNLISAPVIFAIFADDYARKNKLILLFLLFPLVGLGFIIWAIVNIVRMHKFGTSQFKLDSVPGVMGGKLSGRICTPVNIAPEDGFELSLKCIKQVLTRAGRNRTTTEYVIWEEDHVVKRELLYQDLTRSEIPVLFAIPYDGRESSVDPSDDETIIWRLNVKAAVPGLDYDATFDVPVFKTETSSADFKLTEDIPALTDNVSAADLLQRENIIISPAYSSGGTRFTFPMGRNIVSCIVITVITLIWTAIAIAIFIAKAPLFFCVIWGVVDLFLIIGLLYSWFDYRVIEIDKYCMNLSGGLFGIGRTKTIDMKEFDKFSFKMSSQTNKTTFFKILALNKEGKRYSVAGGIKGKKLAETLIEEMNKAAGR